MSEKLLKALVRLAVKRGYRDPRAILAGKPAAPWWLR